MVASIAYLGTIRYHCICMPGSGQNTRTDRRVPVIATTREYIRSATILVANRPKVGALLADGSLTGVALEAGGEPRCELEARAPTSRYISLNTEATNLSDSVPNLAF